MRPRLDPCASEGPVLQTPRSTITWALAFARAERLVRALSSDAAPPLPHLPPPPARGGGVERANPIMPGNSRASAAQYRAAARTIRPCAPARAPETVPPPQTAQAAPPGGNAAPPTSSSAPSRP